MKSESISEVIGDLDFTKSERTIEYTTLTLWVPKEEKEKYNTLQKKTARDFGKALCRLVSKAINGTDQKSS